MHFSSSMLANLVDTKQVHLQKSDSENMENPLKNVGIKL